MKKNESRRTEKDIKANENTHGNIIIDDSNSFVETGNVQKSCVKKEDLCYINDMKDKKLANVATRMNIKKRNRDNNNEKFITRCETRHERCRNEKMRRRKRKGRVEIKEEERQGRLLYV